MKRIRSIQQEYDSTRSPDVVSGWFDELNAQGEKLAERYALYCRKAENVGAPQNVADWQQALALAESDPATNIDPAEASCLAATLLAVANNHGPVRVSEIIRGLADSTFATIAKIQPILDSLLEKGVLVALADNGVPALGVRGETTNESAPRLYATEKSSLQIIASACRMIRSPQGNATPLKIKGIRQLVDHGGLLPGMQQQIHAWLDEQLN